MGKGLAAWKGLGDSSKFPPEKINFKVPSSPRGEGKLYSLGSQKRLLIHTGHECVSSVLVSS